MNQATPISHAGRTELADQLFHDLLGDAPCGYLVADSDGRLVFANQLAAQMLGYEPPDLTGQELDRVLSGPSPAGSDLSRIAGEGVPDSKGAGRDLSVFSRDGREVPIELGLSSLTLNGRAYSLCSMVDLSRRRRLEGQIRTAEESLALACKSARQGVWEWDFAADCLRYSPSFAELLGFPAQALAQDTGFFASLFHPDDWDTVLTLLRSAIDRRIHFNACNVECRLRTKDGEHRWFRLWGQPEWDPNDRPARFVGVIMDITEHHAMIETVKASREQFQWLSESLPICIFEVDLAGTCLYRNRAWESIFGGTGLDRLAEPWPEWFHPDDRRDLQLTWAELASSFGCLDQELRILHPDQGTRWVRLQLMPMVNDAQTRYIGTIEDITPRKQAEAERDRAQQQFLQVQKLEAIGTLAGGIAHDFNNLLWVMMGNAERITRKLPAESPVQPLLETMLSAAKRAKGLVDQILTFSRRSDSKTEPIRIDALVNETLTLLRATLPAGVEIRAEVTQAGLVKGDPTQVHQVIMNLCTNAYHAMGERGVLGVTLEAIEIHPRTAHYDATLHAGPYLLLEISDTGCGMTAETQARIFEPFFTTKEVGKGTGLGLSVAHGIVTSMGGAIRVYSEVGQGTTFRLYLPRCEEAGAPAAGPSCDHSPTTCGEHILIVDDEPNVLVMLHGMLEDLGYRVTACARGQQAIDLVHADPTAFALVITDQTMPTLSGVELAGRLRAIRADLPIIVASGYSRVLSEAAATSQGFRRYLRKPIEFEELRQAVAEILHPEPGGSHG